MLKVSNKNTRTMPLAPVSLLLTLNIFHTFFRVSIVNFKHVIADLVNLKVQKTPRLKSTVTTFISGTGKN